MEPITTLIAMAGLIGGLLLRPVWALAIYCTVLFCYPQPLTLKLGLVEFSACRIIILGVMANALFLSGCARKFKWNRLDLCVLLLYIAQTIAFSTNVDSLKLLISRGGVLFDFILPYFAARLIVTSKEDFMRLAKVMVFALMPLALLGLYESRTGVNPVGFMRPYFSWGEAAGDGIPTYNRHGFYRASVTIGNAISFGLVFAGMVPLCLARFASREWTRIQIFLATGLMLLGVLTSMSSAPLFSLTVTALMLAVFPWRRYWPVLAALFLAWVAFVEIFSNRHFYHVLTLFAFDPVTAYYRIGLYEEAFGGGMSNHWFMGYGLVGLGPGNDNSQFTWEHLDLTSQYILVLARTGLFGLIPYLLVVVSCYRSLIRAAGRAHDKGDAWMIWCLAAALVGWHVSTLTVAFLAQLETLHYLFLGISGSMPLIVRQGRALPKAAKATRRVLRRRPIRRRTAGGACHA